MTATTETYGFWAMLTLLVFQNVVIPLANKIIPQKVKAGIDYDLRMVAAVEQSNKVLAQIVEVQRKAGEDHAAILVSLGRHGEALAVILDRMQRVEKNKKKTPVN